MKEGAQVTAVKTGITNQSYDNAQVLADALKPRIGRVDAFRLVEELYDVGVIGNVDTVNGKKRYFWSHRQEEHLDAEMGITVHPGLLNFFNVRHR